ncbi:MAG: hypothetical protein EoVTN8_409 [Fluviibacter phosphoraccumulans EoVTN8]
MKNKFFLAFCIQFGIFLVFPLLKYLSIHYNVCDFGLLVNNIQNVSNDLSRVVVGHFQPFLFLFGVLYRTTIFNPAEIILIFQSLVLSISGTWILYRYGFVVFFAYILNPLTWSLLAEFHIDTITIPILLLFFYYIERIKYTYALISIVAIMFVKEVYVLLGLFMLLYWTLNQNIKKIRLYQLALVIGISAAILIAYYIGFPEYIGAQNSYNGFTFNGSYQFSAQSDMISEKKIRFLFFPLISLLFIPLASLNVIFIVLPLQLLYILSNNESYVSIYNHYVAPILLVYIIAFAYGLNLIQSKYLITITVKLVIISLFLLINVLTSVSPISITSIREKYWAYSLSAYIPNSRDATIRGLINENIPDGSLVSFQNTVFYQGDRKFERVYPFPIGVFNPIEEITIDNVLNVKRHEDLAQYVVIDLRRPPYLADTGCTWIYGGCKDTEISNKFHDLLTDLSMSFVRIVEDNGFSIYKRKM